MIAAAVTLRCLVSRTSSSSCLLVVVVGSCFYALDAVAAVLYDVIGV